MRGDLSWEGNLCVMRTCNGREGSRVCYGLGRTGMPCRVMPSNFLVDASSTSRLAIRVRNHMQLLPQSRLHTYASSSSKNPRNIPDRAFPLSRQRSIPQSIGDEKRTLFCQSLAACLKQMCGASNKVPKQNARIPKSDTGPVDLHEAADSRPFASQMTVDVFHGPWTKQHTIQHVKARFKRKLRRIAERCKFGHFTPIRRDSV